MFYEQTLGMPVAEHNDFACVLDANGVMLRSAAVRAPGSMAVTGYPGAASIDPALLPATSLPSAGAGRAGAGAHCRPRVAGHQARRGGHRRRCLSHKQNTLIGVADTVTAARPTFVWLASIGNRSRPAVRKVQFRDVIAGSGGHGFDR
jgi:hypothetical protein